MIDFTTTAVIRPEILTKTYNSFNKNLIGLNLKQCTLYINIDPLPNNGDVKSVIRVAEQYFGKVIAHTPSVPNFTDAYNWCWSSAKSNFIFNLEDDWMLTKKIDIQTLLNFFTKNECLYAVALRAYPYKYDKIPMSPSIMHRKFYSNVGGKLNNTINPEIQLRGECFGLTIDSGRVIIYPEHIVLEDLGRKWLKSSLFKRPKRKCRFTTWEIK